MQKQEREDQFATKPVRRGTAGWDQVLPTCGPEAAGRIADRYLGQWCAMGEAHQPGSAK